MQSTRRRPRRGGDVGEREVQRKVDGDRYIERKESVYNADDTRKGLLAPPERGGMAELLAEERRRATFDRGEMFREVMGDRADRVLLIYEAFLTDEVLKKTVQDKVFMSHADQYLANADAAKRFHELCWRNGISDVADMYYISILIGIAPLPTDVHMAMFVPILQSQMTQEQADHWLPQATSFKIIGAYVQTELGHGSNVRRLETTATYDPSAQAFDLHTPTLSATKWWPGGLGKTATHAAVFARLVTMGKDRGIHGFLVQLRSMADHAPLPGVSVGDIGPKMGFAGTDNGYVRFEHVRVPLGQMFMRYAVVHPDGRYERAGDGRLAYAAMLHSRARMVVCGSLGLSRAVLIATRYSIVRKQGGDEGGKPECSVLDHLLQLRLLMPITATAYALHFVGEEMDKAYSAMEALMKRDQAAFATREGSEFLAEMHASTAGLKAVVAAASADGIEGCRRLCGGHGYSALSGLPAMAADFLSAVTLEGTGQVLSLQTARRLLKVLALADKSGGAGGEGGERQVGGGTAYLHGYRQIASRRCACSSAKDFLRLRELEEALEARAVRAIVEAASTYAEAAKRHGAGGAAVDRASVGMSHASTCHCELVAFRCFRRRASPPRGSPQTPVGAALGRLCAVYGLHLLERDMGHLSRYLTPPQGDLLREASVLAAEGLRGDAVALAEAWHIPEAALGSALGREDGDYCRGLVEGAAKEPLNLMGDVTAAYARSLRPLMQGLPHGSARL